MRVAIVAVCEAIGIAVSCFTQSAKESENLPLTQMLGNSLAKPCNLDVMVKCSDTKMNRIKPTKWCNQNGIPFELCAPDTHAQNSDAERFKRLIIQKGGEMRLSAYLPHKLWRAIMFTAKYLYNQTSRASNDEISLYKAFDSYLFDKEEASGPQKPFLHHLRAFGCKLYVLIKSKRDLQYSQKRRNLDAKAHIGFLIRYESTNIYRI